MPVVFTFDIEGAPPVERNRIQSFFERLGWENLGGSSYRYPRLGTTDRVEDWLNHIVPALMLFRAYILTSQRRLSLFTIDVQSSSGFSQTSLTGTRPEPGNGTRRKVKLYAPNRTSFGEQNLRDWLDHITFPYPAGVAASNAGSA